MDSNRVDIRAVEPDRVHSALASVAAAVVVVVLFQNYHTMVCHTQVGQGNVEMIFFFAFYATSLLVAVMQVTNRPRKLLQRTGLQCLFSRQI